MMKQRTRTNDFSHSVQQIIKMMMMHRTLVVIIMLLQQMTTTHAVKFKGDSCISKHQSGICKEWGECTIIKTLIESGEYTSREVVSCGFGIKEELICCPVPRNDQKSETTTVESTDRFTEPTTTQAPVRDFWLDLLQNTTSSTTVAPDFWLDLLKPTVTTVKPLIVGEQRLNESSDFFDFNALLGGNQSAGSKQERETSSGHVKPVNNPANQGLIAANGDGRDNLNTGPVNVNQWNFGQTGNSFNGVPEVRNLNNGRGHNGQGNFPGNFGWSQQNNIRGPFNGQQNFNSGHNMGRGPQNNNGRGHNNGRGPHNNGRGRNGFGMENENQGFRFPESNMRNNNFFGVDQTEQRNPDRVINNIQELNPNMPFANKPTTNNNNKQFNNNEERRIEDLIKNVFEASSVSPNDRKQQTDTTLDASIANIFNVNKARNPSLNSLNPSVQQINNPQPVVWLTPQGNNNNHEVEYVELHGPHQQVELANPQIPGQFQVIPAMGHQVSSNDLDVAPSTSFIQQPVVVETWPSNPAQFAQQPGQIIVLQPQQQMQQLVQQPQFIYQQPFAAQNFRQQIHQQLVQQPLQMEAAGKEPRSTSPLQQFVPQANGGPSINVQSPPTQILDPFKPFQFRPPPEDENNFSEDNNSLSTNINSGKTDTKTNSDRPAVRACRRIERGLAASLSPHILGGTPAELGEFPHMAAIGYSRIGGDDRPPYDIRCGGTLIDKRFVLTAAHCVSERENVPSIVRLGVVNFTDVNQMKAAVELRIKQTYIHDDYLTRLTYNDIAILELERDVEFSEYIYPVCLYTNVTDPETKIKLWVTGWGTVNTTTRSFSDILLKAPLHTSPLQNCNKSFTDYGLNRRIPEGIIRTQFCAEDKDQIKDACQGDSGGPLNMIIDESYKNYRLVGVVSSGFGCASSTPGLYTRVAAFLEFIEKIVWPNGGD